MFTDENLKSYPIKGVITMSEERWNALLARLEAAEECMKILIRLQDVICEEDMCKSEIEVWRKVAGK